MTDGAPQAHLISPAVADFCRFQQLAAAQSSAAELFHGIPHKTSGESSYVTLLRFAHELFVL